MSNAILVLDSNLPAREALATALEQAGYYVMHAASEPEAFDLLTRRTVELVVADVGADPAMARGLLERLRRTPGCPAAILLGAHRSCEAIIAAFRAGAADYLLKPFTPDALHTSVAAALAYRAEEHVRATALNQLAAYSAELQGLMRVLTAGAEGLPGNSPDSDDLVMVVGGLRIGRSRREVLVDGWPLAVTPTEYRLLRCLAEVPHQAVPCRAIVRHTHNYEATDNEAAGLLKSHVRNLRRKLPRAYLVTVRGTGYMLAPQPSEPLPAEVVGNGKLHALELGM